MKTMKNKIKKTIHLLLLIAVLSACTGNLGNSDSQTHQGNLPEQGYQASAIRNSEMILTVKSSELFDGNGRTAFLSALEQEKQQFNVNDASYHFEPVGEYSYRIYRLTPIAETILNQIEPMEGVVLSEELIGAIQKAQQENQLTFEHRGMFYVLSQSKKAAQVSTVSDVAVASQYHLETYDPADNEIVQAFDFVLNLTLALEQDARTFSYQGDTFGILSVPGGFTISDSNFELFAEYSNIYVIPKGSAISSLPLKFKNLVRDAIENEKSNFTFTDSSGNSTEYNVEEHENAWSVSPAK